MILGKLLPMNALLFLVLIVASVDSQLLSMLAIASLAGLFRPKAQYRPPSQHQHAYVPHSMYYDQMVPSASHVNPVMLPPPPPPPPSLLPSASSQRHGFGFPISPRNPITASISDWTRSLRSHPESQRVPSFYGSYPQNGYQFIHGSPSMSSLNGPKLPGVQPVHVLNNVGDHFKSIPSRGNFRLGPW